MGTATSLARMELRRGWRSMLPIGLLVAAVTAIVLWSLATARRTESAFDRMLDDTAAWHVLVNPGSGVDTALTTDDLLGVAGVSDASRLEAVPAFPDDLRTIDEITSFPGIVFATDGGSGYRVGRPIVVAGQMPDADSSHGIFLDTDYARIRDLRPGDALDLRFLTLGEAEEMFGLTDAAYAGELPLEEADARVDALLSDPSFAPARSLTVTGVGRYPDTVAVDGGFELPTAMITPELFRELGSPALMFGGWHVRLDDPTKVDEFRDAVDAIAPGELIVYQTMDNVEAKAERSTRTPSGVLAVFSIVVLVLGVLLVGQAVQRWLLGRSSQSSVVHGLGATRGERWRSTMFEVGTVTVLGSAVGILLAFAGSPFAPVGPARDVEPDPGFQVDGLVLGLGAIAIAAIVIAGVGLPAWWSAGRLSRGSEVARSRVARVVAGAGVPLSVETGVRFALDAVPGRRGAGQLAIVGVLTGVMLATAAIVFTASIDHVTSTPRLYGTNWSATVSFEGGVPETDASAAVDDAVATVLRDEAVRAASSMHAGELAIAGSRMPVVAFRDSERPVGATVVSGRLPASPDEVAFGRTTLSRLGIGVGDRVSVGSDMGTLDATVVGQVVLPAVGTYSGADKTSLGEGAVIDASLLDPFESLTSIVVQLDPGADPADLEERLATALSDFGDASLDSSELPSEVRSLEALAAFPRWLTLVLAALVGVPVAHSLVVSVRARRHDLAVMAALGARPRTLRGIGTFQGFTVVIAAAFLGVPLGVLLGRWSWSALAVSFGTVPEPIVPLVSVAVLTLAVLALGGLVGTVPVWRSSRRTTISSLRPE